MWFVWLPCVDGQLRPRPVLRLPRPHRPFPMTSNHATTETSLGEADQQSIVPPTRRPRPTTAPVIFERRTSRRLPSHGGHGCRRADPASRLGDPSGPAVMWAQMRAAVTAVSSSLKVASWAAALTARCESRGSRSCATSAASRTGAHSAARRRRSTRQRFSRPTDFCMSRSAEVRDRHADWAMSGEPRSPEASAGTSVRGPGRTGWRDSG